jgi:hypothetical protein
LKKKPWRTAAARTNGAHDKSLVATVAKHATVTAAGIEVRSRDGGWRRAAMAAKEEAVMATRGRAATATEDGPRWRSKTAATAAEKEAATAAKKKESRWRLRGQRRRPRAPQQRLGSGGSGQVGLSNPNPNLL